MAWFEPELEFNRASNLEGVHMEQVKAGRAIVDVLEAEGVSTVFGLPGGHVLGIYDALYDSGEIRHVLVRHERTANIGS